jgi:hypothetical protein
MAGMGLSGEMLDQQCEQSWKAAEKAESGTKLLYLEQEPQSLC